LLSSSLPTTCSLSALAFTTTIKIKSKIEYG
jgi:hypothetical protein